MRELTDRELDAVCGGAFQFGILSFQQQISNRQTNNATQVQVSGGGILSGNIGVIAQGNFANNQNIV
jgi:hypothetical protein